MPDDTAFVENIRGVSDLISDDTNKTQTDTGLADEGPVGDYEDLLELPMPDKELLDLKEEWERAWGDYGRKIKSRQDRNKIYYQGKQRSSTGQSDRVVSSNLLFEAEETFIPQALSQNPEPVVFSDNTDEGKEASNDLKTMLQFHADVFSLRRKLATMVRHWSIYFIAVMKYGWDEETNDIKMEVRKPQNFVFDPDGYIDEFGDFKGKWLGERCQTTAKDLIEQFPSHEAYITLKTNGKLGTSVIWTEWWTDKYCFSTFEDEVLDKHKNEFFNYPVKEKDEEGNEIQSATPEINHFAIPKMPYTFLSVFSLQEHPHDVTSLIEQNIANQDRINDRDDQISKNLASGNNAVALSDQAFTIETAGQAVESFYQEGFLLVPGGNIDESVKRIPASALPSGIMESQERDELKLRQIFGTQGLTATPGNEQTTARGMILNQSHDSSRIGGGVGDSVEQVAKNVFNWLVQLYCVFYDEPHYAAAMGRGKAVEYVTLINTFLERKFVVSVAPNSMKPKDEITEQNLAIELANAGWLDPINLFKRLDDADPMNTAKMVALWRVSPQMYMQQFFPEQQQQQVGGGVANPPDVNGAVPPSNPGTLSAPPASPALSQVPINTQAAPQL